MNVDREQQRKILDLLSKAYPWRTNELLNEIDCMILENEDRTIGNLLYLQMHGLIDECVNVTYFGSGSVGDEFGSKVYSLNHMNLCLTEKGIDFLMGDEGLSSVLNVTTVRLETESMHRFIGEFIKASNLSDEDKNSLVERVKKIPLTVLINRVTEQADKLVQNPQAIIGIIQSLIQSFP